MTDDDPHDGMLPYTDDQERAAEAAAKARQAVARDPESALSGPEGRDWRGWLVLGAMALVALAFMAIAGFAQDNCGPRADIAKRLTEKYHEAPVWMGLQGPEMVLEIWSAPAGGTWTALYTYPDGRACIVAAGRGWEARPLPVAGEPA